MMLSKGHFLFDMMMFREGKISILYFIRSGEEIILFQNAGGLYKCQRTNKCKDLGSM